MFLDQDMFGHPIGLNFAQKGEEHKTMLGGFFSLLINILLIIYFAICVNKLVTGEENLRITTMATLDLVEYEDVSYADTSLTLFAIIRKDGHGSATPYINGSSGFSQYVNVYWTQVIANYYIPKNDGLNRFIYKNISARNCTLEDFGDDQESIDIFRSWDGYSMVCPDFGEDLDDF